MRYPGLFPDWSGIEVGSWHVTESLCEALKQHIANPCKPLLGRELLPVLPGSRYYYLESGLKDHIYYGFWDPNPQ